MTHIEQSLEKLAMRFAILVTMSKNEFAGHEEELVVINEQLWDRFGQPTLGQAIVKAKQILKMVCHDSYQSGSAI